jgi:hypothetical protein
MTNMKKFRPANDKLNATAPFIPVTSSQMAKGAFMVMRTLAMMLVGLLVVSNAEAATLTGVNGHVVHGATVVIAGTSFGAKGGSDPNKPLLWADFETSINPTPLGIVTSWDLVESLSRTSAATQYGLSTNNVVGTWPGGGQSASFGFSILRHVSKVYMAGKRRNTDMTYGGTGYKFFRIWAPGTSVDIVASTSGNGTTGGVALDESCIPGGQNQNVTLPVNTWRMDEFLWKEATTGNCSTQGTTGGYFQYIQNGASKMLWNNTFPTSTAAQFGSSNAGIRVMDNFVSFQDALPGGAQVLMDDLYLDDTWARVMIGNASTFAASTVREVQIPMAWADGSITIQVNRGSFGASASAYLYVIDSTNTPSAGLPITFGGGTSDTTPPLAPQNLKIQ